jgi:predicted nucleotidyltransferase
MRLTPREADIIKRSVLKHAPDAQVFLFGSRVDDAARGGDIDVLVITQFNDLETKLKVKAEFFKSLDEQKIDLVLAQDKEASPFVSMAYEQAEAL